jgi:hypothetical protein
MCERGNCSNLIAHFESGGWLSRLTNNRGVGGLAGFSTEQSKAESNQGTWNQNDCDGQGENLGLMLGGAVLVLDSCLRGSSPFLYA